MGGHILISLFLGVFVLIGVAMLGFGLRSYSLSKQAAAWPTTPGVITVSDFRESSDSDGTTYTVKVNYTYNPDGIERAGDRIAFGYMGSSSRKLHEEIRDALPVGARVAVRYDPADPSRAALTHGVNNSIIFLILFGAVWTMFTLGMAAMLGLGEQGAGALVENMVVYSR